MSLDKVESSNPNFKAAHAGRAQGNPSTSNRKPQDLPRMALAVPVRPQVSVLIAAHWQGPGRRKQRFRRRRICARSRTAGLAAARRAQEVGRPEGLRKWHRLGFELQPGFKFSPGQCELHTGTSSVRVTVRVRVANGRPAGSATRRGSLPVRSAPGRRRGARGIHCGTHTGKGPSSARSGCSHRSSLHL